MRILLISETKRNYLHIKKETIDREKNKTSVEFDIYCAKQDLALLTSFLLFDLPDVIFIENQLLTTNMLVLRESFQKHACLSKIPIITDSSSNYALN